MCTIDMSNIFLIVVAIRKNGIKIEIKRLIYWT